MKCVNCGNKSDNLIRGYCPECINGKQIPCHAASKWHSMVNSRDKEIRRLKGVIKIFKLEEQACNLY